MFCIGRLPAPAMLGPTVSDVLNHSSEVLRLEHCPCASHPKTIELDALAFQQRLLLLHLHVTATGELLVCLLRLGVVDTTVIQTVFQNPQCNPALRCGWHAMSSCSSRTVGVCVPVTPMKPPMSSDAATMRWHGTSGA